MQTLQELDVNYMSGIDNPWIPFTPLTDQVFLKYWKVDPVRAEIIVSMKFPAGLELPPHYHTGIVVGHTVSGAWRYQENNWISRAGDTVYEVAGSSHTPESLEDTEVFFFLVGELLFSRRRQQDPVAGEPQDLHRALHQLLRRQRDRLA